MNGHRSGFYVRGLHVCLGDSANINSSMKASELALLGAINFNSSFFFWNGIKV